ARSAIALDATGAGGTQTFTPVQGSIAPVDFQTSAVSGSADAIHLPGHGFSTGEAVTYSTTGTAIDGLTSGPTTTYYVSVLDATTIRLADTQADAVAGHALPIDPTVATGTQTFTPQAGSAATTTTPANVTGIANTITVPKHGFITGEAVTFTAADGNGSEVGPLTTNTIYYVIVVDPDTIELAETQADAFAGNALRLDPMIGSGDQVLTPSQPPAFPASFNPSAVRNAGNTITLPSHGFVTGEQLTYSVASGGAAIQGLTPGTIYYAIVVDATTIRLAG